MVMTMNFELDIETLAKIIEEKAKLPPEVRDGIVAEVGQGASERIESKIPIDTGITASYWYPSTVRSYDDQSWMTVSFDPYSFGNVGSKKKGWNQRNGSNSGWGWGWLSCFDPRNGISYMWLPKAIRSEKNKIKKELKSEVENYYKNL